MTRAWLTAVVWWCFFATAWTRDLQKLPGHVPTVTARLAPVGRLDGTKHLQLAISLPSRDPNGLSRLLHGLYDPTSSQYRHFLTPAQFTDQFGPTQQSYQALANFAKANHLTVTTTHPNRLVLDVDGAVSDIEKTFHVTMRVFQHPTEGRLFYAPDRDPSVNFAQPILHVNGLDNYALPRPNLKARPVGQVAGATDNATANSGSGPSGNYVGNDFRAAYVPGTSLTGTGQSVGLLEFDAYYPVDITNYETQFGLPNVPLVNVAIDGGVTTPGDGDGEVSLDIEMVISMAPGVSAIYVYESSGSWVDMLNRMATDNLAKQLSCSWYIPSGAAEPAVELIFQQMAAQGQSFFAASGDSDAYTGLIPFPSDSPSITTVGGTTLTTSGPGGSFVSESVWNWGLDNGAYVGSSGGISTNYSLPTWQQGISMTANLGSTAMRNVPDVALTGDNVWVTYDNGGSGSFGGTSCAAPLWAAFTALVNQQAAANGQPSVGFLNPALYNIALNSSYTSNFHDVTTGNNFSASSPTQFPAVAGYDLATGLGSPMGATLIASLAGPPDALIITGTNLIANGPVGGPFVPASTSYTLTNSGASSLNWTVTSSQPWLTVSPASGTLGPGAFATVSVSPNSAANSLAIGSDSALLSVVDATSGITQTRPATLTVLGPPSMTVTPSGSFASQGNVGGPFSPSSVTYTITNTGAPSMNWTASNSSNWLSLSSAGGTLAAGASTTVTASIATPANSLALGAYNDSIVFTNTTNGVGNTAISASLSVTNQVQIAQPPQVTTYSGDVRGYWFTSPATFVISGLQVPTDASSGAQSIAVLKLTSAPPLYPSTTNTFTTLFLTQNNPASGIIPVTIPVNQGDIIGILGCRAEINSYGTAPFTTQILGQPVTMARFGMQFPLDTSPPQSVWADTTTGYLSRVNMYVSGSTTAPIITSALSATASLAQPFNYQITATNSPTSYNATGLPAGLSINTGTGLISGTPITAGTTNVTISATNATGTGTATLAITVLSAPPVITSSLTASGSTSSPFTYTITASNGPTSYSATGLPGGLSVNTGTGVISGTPTAAGASNITISATNNGGTGSATLVLTVTLGTPAITSPLSATAVISSAFSYSITATGSPTSYNATGLPAGLSVNTGTGIIGGTPTATGTSNVTISATNSVGTGSAILVLTVAPPPPVITSALTASDSTGTPFTYTITATNSPTSYNATGLPAGLSVNTGTGVISGTPTAVGVSSVTISATNASGTGSATLTVSITQALPGFVTTGPLNFARADQATVLLGNGKVLVAGGLNGSPLATAELYDPTTGTWTATGSLNTARYQATGTLLPNGKVLIAGGLSASGAALSSAEIYDPATGLWTNTGAMNTARGSHVAVLLSTGKVLACGGYNGNVLASAEIYDPTAGAWTVTGSMATGRYIFAGVLLSSGKVYVAGGFGPFRAALAVSEIYDPVAGTWTGTWGLNTARYDHTLSLLPNGNILIAGGYTGSTALSSTEVYASSGTTLTGSMNSAHYLHTASLLPNGKVLAAGGNTNAAELYNYTTGTWTTIGSLNAVHTQHTATIMTNGKVLVAGGAGNVTETYDSASGTWSSTVGSMTAGTGYPITKLLPTGKVLVAGNLIGNTAGSELYDPTSGAWSSTGSLNVGRSESTSVLLSTGQVLIAGGYAGGATASAELYNPASGTWTKTGSLNAARGSNTGTLLPNGQVLAAGGTNFAGGTTFTSCELYNPSTGAWTATGSMATPHTYHVAALLANGKVLVAGGNTGSSVTNVAELYNPATGTWTTTGSLAVARDNCTATLLPNGQVLVAGGGGSTYFSSAELYNPTTGTWTTTGSLNIARWLHTATLLPNGKVLVAGGYGASGDLANSELYDPATGTWTVTGNLVAARSAPTAALLASGKVLILGGYGSGGYLAISELYDPGLGFSSTWQPAVTSATSPLAPGGSLAVAGTGFSGIAGASSGTVQDSPSNHPVVQLSAVENGQASFLLSSPSTNWSSTSFTSAAVSGFPYGYALATVFTNGIPSSSAVIDILPSTNATLSNLVLSAGALTPVFASGTASYTAGIPYTTSSITVTPTVANGAATVQVNGVSVASGSASGPLNLATGPNAINVVVTAQDGVTMQTYAVTVTRDDTVITTQSGTQIDPTGQAATFSVSVTGTGPFTYQWYYDGAAISGATNSSYTIPSVASGNAGTYWVVVTNVYGVTTSNTYTLTVSPPVPAMPPWGLVVLPALLFMVVARFLPGKSPASS